MVQKRIIDFSADEGPPDFKTGTHRVMNKKQIRARARRGQRITEAELQKLYKPIEQWDEEELARGRPRAKDGSFKGKSPNWITREMHEAALSRFKGVVEGKMRQETVTALGVVHAILSNDDTDEKGKPLIPASTKLEAAKFLIEHAVGKPTQRVETDISVRLQGLLAVATTGPLNGGAEMFTLPPGDDYEAAFGKDDEEIEAEVVE